MSGSGSLDPEKLFTPLISASGILAAVSGGPDSMALMHLLASWAPEARPPLFVATIDHGLRPEAVDEAALVATQARRLGLPHRILPWEGKKPVNGLQKAARDARYRLLVAYAREVGATHIVTAHTLDDQAETMLMRLSRGSGLAGLAGMRGERDLDGLRLVRPLLAQEKATLIALCRAEDWPFVTDPSNRNTAFARIRWRTILPLLAEEGLTAQRLARLSERARRAEEALATKADDAFARGSSDQARSFRGAILAEEPFEIALRGLDRLLSQGQGEPDHRRLERLETCLGRLRASLAAKEAVRLTIAGQILDLDRDGGLVVAAEPARRRGR